MARVEWSALGGDEIEALLSNLFYNRHERAIRIRPDQGDHGVDLILPASHDDKLLEAPDGHQPRASTA